MTTAPTPAIPAATLVIFRDTDAGPELLMVERARAMAFAAGALVFPGGRIEPGDAVLAALLAPDLHDGAARVCAIRETIEEAGVATGFVPPPAPATVAAIRTRLHAGEEFAAILSATSMSLDLDTLLPFARWRPAHAMARIFDTLFYLARLPPGAAEATADTTENSRLAWMRAAQVLADADAGAATIIYPTRRNLERLAQFADFASAVTDARRHPVVTITPFVEHRDGIAHLCIPDGLGYPITSEPLTSATRG